MLKTSTPNSKFILEITLPLPFPETVTQGLHFSAMSTCIKCRGFNRHILAQISESKRDQKTRIRDISRFPTEVRICPLEALSKILLRKPCHT